MTPTTAIAQLRHLYDHVTNLGNPRDTELARGLLSPAIEALEKAHAPGAPDLLSRISTANPHEAARLSGELLEKVRVGGAAVVVKPLVWTTYRDATFLVTYHTVDLGLGRYYQIMVGDKTPGDFGLWTETKDMEDPPYGTVSGTHHPTLEAAQAAAFEEWSAFILAAVEETP